MFVCFNDYFLLYANTFVGEFLAAEVVVAEKGSPFCYHLKRWCSISQMVLQQFLGCQFSLGWLEGV